MPRDAIVEGISNPRKGEGDESAESHLDLLILIIAKGESRAGDRVV